MIYILINFKAGNDKNVRREAIEAFNEETTVIDPTIAGNIEKVISNLKTEDKIVLCGGDGTINHFMRKVRKIPENDILLLPTGSGNDFWREIKENEEIKPIRINEYLSNLPTAVVNGNEYPVINGVGYGIDGFCCVEGDKLRESNKTINYTSIAIKGCLFSYKPCNATVVVDGETHYFKKVWLAPIMNGKYYGGGMIPTPNQRRNSGKISVMLFHGSGRLKTLMIFPSIFEGKHIEKTKNVAVFEGKNITVKFDQPRPLQIDGEVIKNVTEYTVKI